ncbi:sulfide/dihydroorotate dehydrogenase-like FAD/NAD-binding protein [Sarcina ventriculi]|uniref:Dihydrdoorotate oxidase B, electron transfer subunit n=1 Tax=Sarcina ventriculi TaxID=1267 RepID=A0ABP2AMU9_SARVE|nr:sulfide/dihydroorotate dehydrogenase-like FAD/NAD-binding protein [Sarcina ventriculi]MBU5321654.1 sulfide/dihydroorotate dehydrogenase-like FAD/NAD-binding protein [Sarcina ventriculi]MDD7373167.1 sulfide/dihydroorotate dehydrogenase-like FAD/NAD-binding protein [Sarcina ventriculi]CUN50445.1 Dihydrdoorotate oxidase B%2C electron transfer subunit [Sarcina ventriculi]
MKYEMIDCIDAGSEFCPCHLAEEGECILCSQLNGRCFCDCRNWKGVCIYQEFKNNGDKAKEGRKTFDCEIVELNFLEDELVCLKVKANHKLCLDLSVPGSFIFIKTKDNLYFDIPISIMESNCDENTLMMMVEIRGIKTKRLLNLSLGEHIGIRGPYFNGVFGIKTINSIFDKNILVLVRGIGEAPALPVIKKLLLQNNKINLVLDKSPFKNSYIKNYLDTNQIDIEEANIIDKGNLSEEVKKIINLAIDNHISLIHCAGADILTYNVINYLDDLNREDINISCCNNSKMCCGEGVCGSCTARFAGHKVKRLCKVQTDPRNIFKERRFI